MTCANPRCAGQALGAGHWPYLCANCALTLLGLRQPPPKGRAEVLAAHEAIHRAFKARNRELTHLAPPRAPAQAAVVAPPEADTLAAVLALLAVGAKPVRVDRRYGDRAPTAVPIGPEHDPIDNPCHQCGSTRTARAPYGVGGDTVWILCKAGDACYARLRKAKAA